MLDRAGEREETVAWESKLCYLSLKHENHDSDDFWVRANNSF